MTQGELEDQRTKAYNDYQINLKKIELAYAQAHNTVAIGDIIKDHMGYIKVESMRLYSANDTPMMIYRGAEMKKDGTPMKKGNKRDLYQSNLKEK